MKRCFFAVVVSLALIITSCSKSSDNGGGLLSKAESALTPSDPWTEFALMSAARLKATSWRSKVLMNQAGQAIEMDSEVMCPDKQHTKMTQGGKVTMESYDIGGTMYLNASGRIMKVPHQTSAAALQCPEANSGAASSAPPSKLSLVPLPSIKHLSTARHALAKYKKNGPLN